MQAEGRGLSTIGPARSPRVGGALKITDMLGGSLEHCSLF
jgi:hypothetical protein